MILKFLLPLFALGILLMAGCSSENGKKSEAQKEVFVPKNFNLKLEVISPRREYYAGELEQEITFRLKNDDLAQADIPDWSAKETDNISLYYMFGEADANTPKSAWKQVWPLPGATPAYCSPLILNPGNSALIQMPLDFLKEVKPEPGKTQKITLRAELNLKSIVPKNTTCEITLK